MKRITFILLAMLVALAGCKSIELDPVVPSPEEHSYPDGKVELSFTISIPDKVADTKAMGNDPVVDNLVVGVFGGSGFLNEWIVIPEGDFSKASENYDSNNTSTLYNVKVRLGMSSSRLRLHFIANCPQYYVEHAPFLSDSNLNTEDYIMSNLIRTNINDPHNDGYWQKVILPNGVQGDFDMAEGKYKTKKDDVTGLDVFGSDGKPIYLPSEETQRQFPSNIVLVRNFARIYLVNEAKDVRIIRYDLAYAPTEGPIAPVLSAPYTSDESGRPIPIDDDDDTPFWPESFFINLQDYPYIAEDGKSCTAAPFNYKGFSPSNLQLGTYPEDYEHFVGEWDPDKSIQDPLFMYERIAPGNALPQATRVLIYAQKGHESPKYYALDILNAKKEKIPIIRNNTYTVVLTGIAENTGENNPGDAATTNSSNVSQSASQEIQDISDGTSSIGTSYTEKVFVSPVTGNDEGVVYFRYLEFPDNVTKTLALNKVTPELGFIDDNVFTPADDSDKIPAIKNVQIEKRNGTPVEYVRKNNAWVEPGTGDEDLEKWGKITFSTRNNDDEPYLVDGGGYYTKSYNETIRVKGESGIYRDVTIKIMPRESLVVKCQQPYVAAATGEKETIRVYIPTELSKSIFPLDFQIEAENGSITPDNDVLPVENGVSIVFNTNNGKESTVPSYHFIKTITLDQYKEWQEYAKVNDPCTPIETIEGKGKFFYFDCYFKTNTVSSASKVFVKNKYFNYGLNTDSFDSFNNYYRREFYDLSLPVVTAGNTATFSFRMDESHKTLTGANVIWHDGLNPLSDNIKRVLPKYINVYLKGCSPADDSLTPNNEGDGYIFANFTSGTASDFLGNNRLQSFKIKVDDDTEGNNYSVTLATECLYNSSTFPILDFYKPVTKTAVTYTFTGGFATAEIPLGNVEDDFTFNYNSECIEPVTVTFTNCAPTGDTRFKKISNGVYQFTPSDGNTAQTFSVTTRADAPPKINLNSDNYNAKDFKTKKWVEVTEVLSFSRENYNSSTINMESGLSFVFDSNTSGGSSNGVYYKTMGSRSGLIWHTYQPGSVTIKAPTGGTITDVVFTYLSDNYDDHNVSYVVSGGSTEETTGNTSWRGTASSLKATMECDANNNYYNRVSRISVIFKVLMEL